MPGLSGEVLNRAQCWPSHRLLLCRSLSTFLRALVGGEYLSALADNSRSKGAAELVLLVVAAARREFELSSRQKRRQRPGGRADARRLSSPYTTDFRSNNSQIESRQFFCCLAFAAPRLTAASFSSF